MVPYQKINFVTDMFDQVLPFYVSILAKTFFFPHDQEASFNSLMGSIILHCYRLSPWLKGKMIEYECRNEGSVKSSTYFLHRPSFPQTLSKIGGFYGNKVTWENHLSALHTHFFVERDKFAKQEQSQCGLSQHVQNRRVPFLLHF